MVNFLQNRIDVRGTHEEFTVFINLKPISEKSAHSDACGPRI